MPSFKERIYPSGKKSWQYTITALESPTGKQIKACGFSTKREAIDACNDKLKHFSELKNIDFPELKFKDGCGIYFERKKLAPATKTKYELFLDNHIYPFFEKCVISEIKPLLIDKWIDDLKRKKVSIGTINESLKICKAICNFLVFKEVIAKNPFKKTDKLPEIREDEEIKHFTPLQAKMLIQTAEKFVNKQFSMILKFAFYTGMREGEIFGFDVKYFDPKNHIIKVRQQFTNGELTKRLKNKTSKRDIFIDETFTAELEKYIHNNHLTGLLFKNNKGRPLNNDNVNFRWWKPLLMELNYDDTMHFHYIRHTYASIRLTAGDNYLAVSKDMGHASPLVTLRIYGHFIPQIENKTVNLSEYFHEHFMSMKESRHKKRGRKPSVCNGGR